MTSPLTILYFLILTLFFRFSLCFQKCHGETIISTEKIKRHWQFNNMYAYKYYLFHHGFHICFSFPLSHVLCIYQLHLEYDPVQISLQMYCTDSTLLSKQIFCLCMQFVYRRYCIFI